MDRKQAIYWLLFSALGFVVLILTGDQPVITDSKDSFNFGIFELAALGLLIGTWIFLTGSNPERKKLKNEMHKLSELLNDQNFDEAKSVWPSLEAQVIRVLAERDPLYVSYQALRFQVSSIRSDGTETCQQAFRWLRRHFKKNQNWEQLMHWSILYAEILESNHDIDGACETLEELHEFAEINNLPIESFQTKLLRLHKQLSDS